MNKEPLKVSCMILAVLAAVLAAAASVLALSNSRLSDELDRSEEELKRAGIEITELKAAAAAASETAPAVTEPPVSGSVFQPPVTDENTVYIYDNGIDTIEFPPIDGAEFNDYDMSELKTDGKKHKTLYDSSGSRRSRFGIDVSSYQTKIDWKAVKADGVEFAIIRLGYRGYESGNLCEDRYFRRNIKGAYDAGIDTGVYFFSQAITAEEAAEEAEYVLSVLAETGITPVMPVIFDWEFPTDEDPARTDGITGDIQTACCRAFCDKITEAGFDTMYYSTINTAIFRYDMGSLSDIPLWIAEYYEKCHFVYDYKMWQYSCSGIVDGIEGFVDLDIYIEN